MIIDKGEIVLTGTDDRQIIYDAMIHYMYSEAEMGRSNHFASDVHAEIAEIASKERILKRLCFIRRRSNNVYAIGLDSIRYRARLYDRRDYIHDRRKGRGEI